MKWKSQRLGSPSIDPIMASPFARTVFLLRTNVMEVVTGLARGSMLLCISMHAAKTSSAMEFKSGTWKGHPAIFADGPIDNGDAAKLSVVGGRTVAAAHGYRLLVLNSPGGSVGEAKKIAAEFQEFNIHTIVQKGGSCDSACGSIIFVAGLLRTVEEGGELGLHTCYRPDTGMPLPACNDSISYNAVANGVSHGSVKGAMDSASPDQMTKLNREGAECWGFVRYSGSAESGFVQIDSCAMKIITGRMPTAQAAWRIDVEQGGFSAFVRTLSDYDLAGQIKVSCNKTGSRAINFEVLVPGSADRVRSAMVATVILGLETPWSTENVQITEVFPNLSAVRFTLPEERVDQFTMRAEDIEVRLDLRRPFDPIRLLTSVKASRSNIRFVLEHCVAE
jgi:hypothetical protein